VANTNYEIGDLVQTTRDYIADNYDEEKIATKKFGIVISPNEGMWGEYEETGTKVQWAEGHQEIVWHFEIERAEK
tara:strand:- start:21 stop:245 length:225 start_codon:yes stop_codon:yes gene_type:complete